MLGTNPAFSCTLAMRARRSCGSASSETEGGSSRSAPVGRVLADDDDDAPAAPAPAPNPAAPGVLPSPHLAATAEACVCAPAPASCRAALSRGGGFEKFDAFDALKLLPLLLMFLLLLEYGDAGFAPDELQCATLTLEVMPRPMGGAARR